MDFLIILLTIVVGFVAFITILYLGSALFFPRMKDDVENYYDRPRRRRSLMNGRRSSLDLTTGKK